MLVCNVQHVVMPFYGHDIEPLENRSQNLFLNITLFKSITMFHGTDNIIQNIPHIHA